MRSTGPPSHLSWRKCQLPDRLEFVVSLLDGIDALPKADRQDLFLNVADTILMIEGQRGKRLVRSLFERYARLLPRGTQSELQHLEALNDVVNAVPLEPGSGKRSATPGRNDPCWCGSGKKYKKCHLSAPS